MLRHEAFDPDVAPPRTLPEPIRAATDDPGPLRPLAPDELDIDSLRAGLARHGCVHVRGMLDAAQVERLVDGIDRALAACDAGLAGAPVSETTPWYAPFTPPPGRYRIGGRRSWIRASGGVWTADSPRMLFELCELIEQMGIGALVEQHLGERPALSANKNTLRRVPVDTNTNWHQDGAFLGQDVRTLNLWIALSPCGTDAPGLDIVPRRFDTVLPTGTDGAIFDWSVSPDVVAEAAGDVAVVRPEFEAGDVLLFDHLMLHRTAVAEGMTRERHAIESWFFAPSGFPEGQIPLRY